MCNTPFLLPPLPHPLTLPTDVSPDSMLLGLQVVRTGICRQGERAGQGGEKERGIAHRQPPEIFLLKALHYAVHSAKVTVPIIAVNSMLFGLQVVRVAAACKAARLTVVVMNSAHLEIPGLRSADCGLNHEAICK